MTIKEFHEKLLSICCVKEEDGDWHYDCPLEIYLCEQDGCLQAILDKKALPIEGEEPEKALDIIIEKVKEYINKKNKVGVKKK